MPFNPLTYFRCLFHYDKLLSPYVDNELESAPRAELERHLAHCHRCSAGLEDIRFASRMASQICLSEEAIRMTPMRAPHALADATGRRRRLILAPVTALMLATVALVSVWLYTRMRSTTWEVVRLAGTPKINASLFNETGSFAVGELLETDNASRARVHIGKIGYVNVEPNTRLRLVSTKMTEQRIALERGKLEATISAPPRIFFVDTPSAQAVDLGCAYTLEVDEQGQGLLQVTAGWVAFALNGYEAKVPAGAACLTRPGSGPGTPYFVDASPEFQSDLKRFDFENGGKQILESLLEGARARDTLTLYHLLTRVDEKERSEVYDKLASYTPPPDGVTREGLLQLDKQMMQGYREKLEATWLQESAPAFRKVWRWLWN
jgi:ferric-dicitrate binding protein FerR (iron transport regulator)